MNLDYYFILEVSKDADLLTIKKSYKRLASIYHPDKTHNDPIKTEHFKKIVLAYEILSDFNKRRSYDSSLNDKDSTKEPETKKEPNYKQPSPKAEPENKDKPIILDVYINWKETISGLHKNISFSIIKYCESCAGRGYIYSKVCNNCQGTGQKAFNKEYKAFIPPNTLPESQLRLKSIGHISQTDLVQGDVILDIHWKNGKWVFINNDMYSYINVSKFDRVRRRATFINYNGEKIIVHLPEDVKEGQTLRLKEKGWNMNGYFTDLYLEVQYKESRFINKIFDIFL